MALMNSSLLPSRLKEKTWWKDVLFYGASGLLVLAALCYLIFFATIYLSKNEIVEIEARIATYGTEEQQRQEKEIISYKKKVEDFNTLLQSRKIALNMFGFLERNTLPKVWFNSFNISAGANEVRVSGETDNLILLSQQIRILEEQKDYVKNITVLQSSANEAIKINFSIAVTFNDKIFNYTGVSLPATSNLKGSSL